MLCSYVMLRVEVVSQGSAIGPLARFVGRAQAHRLVVLARKGGTGLRHVPCLRSAFVAQFVVLEVSCLARVWRGKLTLMACNESVLHQPPNPSIERTPSGMLRMPTVAAHVQR